MRSRGQGLITKKCVAMYTNYFLKGGGHGHFHNAFFGTNP